MRCLSAFTICALMISSVEAHLHRERIRLRHEQMVPFGTPFEPRHNMFAGPQQLPDPFLTSPGLFGGDIFTQGGFPNVVQWPQTSNNQLIWNSIFSVPPTDRNDINNNVLPNTDPWEQYRRFNNGVQRMSDGRRWSSSVNSISSGSYPWNTFATQDVFGTNVPTILNNQGFVNPQFHSDVNQFQNQGFLSQGFPNNNQIQNQGFLSQAFPNNNKFQNQGFLSQTLPNNNQFQNK